MKQKFNIYKNYFVNLIFPAFIFGSITGIITSVVVTLFKLCAKYIIQFSNGTFEFMRERVYLIPIAIILALGASYIIALVFKKEPNLRGGGIPHSIAVLRGITSFNWLKALVSSFVLPMISFLFGVPLGTEGPSVLIGTAIGKGSTSILAKKHMAWNKYSMTAGASSGFSVATGSPISGIIFAIEEIHGRISPMILMVATVSVAFSRITSELLSKISFLNIEIELFSNVPQVQALRMRDVWIPIVIALVVGILSVLFLYYYRLIYNLFNKALSKVPHFVRLFIILSLSIIFGVISINYISTGHHLIESILTGGALSIGSLVLILLIRSTLTLGANSTSVNGGMFIPIMAQGAIVSAICAKIMISLGLDSSCYSIIIIFGITACISGMMKTPLTAIVFAIEALSCYENILFVIIVSILSFAITEIFRAKSINETIIERRTNETCGNKTVENIDTNVTIKEGAFAIGKQIRDIFWPYTLKVLSVKHSESSESETDQYADNVLRKGDVLHIRYSTTDKNETQKELFAIIGEQE